MEIVAIFGDAAFGCRNLGLAVEQGEPIKGDILLAVDDAPVRAAEYLGRILNRTGSREQPRTLAIVRAGERQTLTASPATAEAA